MGGADHGVLCRTPRQDEVKVVKRLTVFRFFLSLPKCIAAQSESIDGPEAKKKPFKEAPRVVLPIGE